MNCKLSMNDFLILDKERKLGISGHLRVKNQENLIAKCIESTIPFLDELIIVYQKSTDKTEEILKEYRDKYRDKIKLYFYNSDLIPFHRDLWGKKDFNYTKEELNIFNIKNPANYYNFGLLKINYKYYMKIDADQIYFTDKFMEIRDKLINKKKTKNKWLNRSLRKFAKDKNAFISMHGLNFKSMNGDFYYNTKKDEYPSIFNGTNDHLLFAPTSNDYYKFKYVKNEYAFEILETHKRKIYDIGFCWFHFPIEGNNYKKLNKKIDSKFLYFKDLFIFFFKKRQLCLLIFLFFDFNLIFKYLNIYKQKIIDTFYQKK